MLVQSYPFIPDDIALIHSAAQQAGNVRAAFGCSAAPQGALPEPQQPRGLPHSLSTGSATTAGINAAVASIPSHLLPSFSAPAPAPGALPRASQSGQAQGGLPAAKRVSRQASAGDGGAALNVAQIPEAAAQPPQLAPEVVAIMGVLGMNPQRAQPSVPQAPPAPPPPQYRRQVITTPGPKW